MKHLTEEQLIALYYGDAERAEALKEHLRSCGTCRENFQSVQHTLGAFKNAPIPERDASYGSQVWYAISRRLDTPQKPPSREGVPWFSIRRFAAVATLAAIVVLAFFAGRYWPRKPTQMAAANPAQIRQGVLLVAVSDHLDHAQMILMELANADGDGVASGATPANVNIATEQARAQQLLISNRLYQQTAQQTGDAEIQNILSALEPVLLEIAHSPDEISTQQFQQIQDRIRSAGILFKVRVVSSDVRDKERSLARRNGQGQT